MEKEIKSPLEREDRENDIDEFVVPGLSIEGMDYKTYLQTLKGEVKEDSGQEMSAKKEEDKSASEPKEARRRTSEEEDTKNRLGLTLFISEEVKILLRIVSAKESKSMSKYVSDLIIKDLRKRKKEIENFITVGLGKSSID